jgi:hypothetical protein
LLRKNHLQLFLVAPSIRKSWTRDKELRLLADATPKFFFQLEPVRFRSSLEVRRTFLIPNVQRNFEFS